MVDLDSSQATSSEIYKRLVELALVDPYVEKGIALEFDKRNDVDYQSKYRGCMLGLAVGDALGKFSEMQPREVILEKYGVLQTYPEEFGPFSMPGAITDDTQMSIWVAEHLLEQGSLAPIDLARKFVSEEIRGIGAAIQEFVKLFRDEGLPWYLSGWESAGNGGAMRAAPVTLFHVTDYNAMKRDVGLQTYITHRDQMAIAGSVVQATAVAMACHTQPGTLQNRKARANFMLMLTESIRGMETNPYYSERYERDTLFRRLTEDLPFYIEWSPEYVLSQWGNGPYVLESLPFALYCFLRSPENFEETLHTAVNYGGDTDTVASMACAIAGAYNGAHVIPEKLLHGLEYKERLIELADKLHARLK
jgi:ADP-ribosyl-[dinitrogen reductase] hydrolase